MPHWVLLACHPERASVTILGFLKSAGREEALELARTRARAWPESRFGAIDLTADDTEGAIRAWLRKCRVPGREIPNLIRKLGRALCDVLRPEDPE